MGVQITGTECTIKDIQKIFSTDSADSESTRGVGLEIGTADSCEHVFY
jgi:hypothetical protein